MVINNSMVNEFQLFQHFPHKYHFPQVSKYPVTMERDGNQLCNLFSKPGCFIEYFQADKMCMSSSESAIYRDPYETSK